MKHGDCSHAKSGQRYKERSYDHYACIPKETWSHLYRKSWISLEKKCGTHTEFEHRKIQYFRMEYQTTSITFQSNMTLKTVVSVIPLVYVKKKERKRKKKKKSVWVALNRKWSGNGQKKRGM